MSLADCQIEEAQESRKTRAEERRSNQKLVVERKPESKRDANTAKEVEPEAQQEPGNWIEKELIRWKAWYEVYLNQETE